MEIKFFIFSLFVFVSIQSQNLRLYGRVEDESGVPIRECLVKLETEFTLTDTSGYFSIQTGESKTFIQISKTGYSSIDTLLVVSEFHIIRLENENIQLEEVAITNKKKKDEFLLAALERGLPFPEGVYGYEAFSSGYASDSLVTACVQNGYLKVGESWKEKIVYRKVFPEHPKIFPLATGPRWLSANFITEGPVHPETIELGSRLIDYKSLFTNVYLIEGLQTASIPSITSYGSYSWGNSSWGALSNQLTKIYDFQLKAAKSTGQVFGKIWIRDTDTTIVRFQMHIGKSYLAHSNAIDIDFKQIDTIANLKVEIIEDGETQNYLFDLQPADPSIKWRKGVQIEYDFASSKPESKGAVVDTVILNKLSSASNMSLEMAYDSMDNAYNELGVWDYIINGIAKYNHRKGYVWWFSPILEQTNIIGIGGYRHNLEGTFQKFDSLGDFWKISARGDYGFNNRDLTGRVRLQRMYNIKQFAYWGFSGGSMYQLLTFGVPLQDLLSRSNYVRNDYISLEHNTQVFRGLFWWMETKFSDRQSIEGLDLAGWSDALFGENNEPLKFNPYQEWRMNSGIDYTPFQKLEVLPFQERLRPSKYPTFSLDFEYGIPKLLGSDVHYLSWELGVKKLYQFANWGRGNYRLYRRAFLYSNAVQFPNYFFLPANTPFLFISPDYTLQLLENTIQTTSELYEARWLHHFDRNLLSSIPILGWINSELIVGGGALWQPNIDYVHAEAYYGIELPFRVSKTKYKLGFFHVLRPDLSDPFRQQFKFGVNFYNSFTGRWNY